MQRARITAALATPTLMAGLTLLLTSAAASCELRDRLGDLQQQASLVDDLTPEVQVSEPTLKYGPSLSQLAAYYCPQVVDDPLVALGCEVSIGPKPAKSSMAFEFGLAITIKNPNDVPVPALDLLVALTLFRGEGAQELGALCVSMCSEDNPDCDGTPRPGACTMDGPDDIRTIDDFVDRLPGLIEDLATGEAQDELRKSTIAAGGDVTLNLSFVLGIDQALTVFQRTALDYVQDYLAGRPASLDVPVSAEGSVFLRVPALGRVGVDYGPIDGVWHIQ